MLSNHVFINHAFSMDLGFLTKIIRGKLLNFDALVIGKRMENAGAINISLSHLKIVNDVIDRIYFLIVFGWILHA